MTDHADLTKKTINVMQDAIAAAKHIHQLGGSPRLQLEGAREVAGRRLVYMPHIGAKQRAKEQRRAAKAQSK